MTSLAAPALIVVAPATEIAPESVTAPPATSDKLPPTLDAPRSIALTSLIATLAPALTATVAKSFAAFWKTTLPAALSVTGPALARTAPGAERLPAILCSTTPEPSVVGLL